MPSTTLTVPIRADDIYRKALRAFADNEGKDMSDIVREALDAKFGVELQPYIEFFVARSDHKNAHSNTKITTKEHVNV